MENECGKSWQKGEVLGLTALLLCLFSWTLAPLQDYDFWFYLAVGQDIWEGRGIPWEQSYLGNTSVLAFEKYADHAWLSAVIFYTFYLLGGTLGLVALKSLLLTAVTAVTYRNCRLLGLAPWSSALWVTLGLWTVRSRFLLRSYQFSDLGLALLILILISFGHQSKQRLIALGILFCVWANCHQGVIAGWVLLFLWSMTGGLPFKQGVQALVTGVGASFLRPHGWEFPALLYDTLGNQPAMGGVIEWEALPLESLLTNLGPFLCISTFLVLRTMVKGQLPKKIPWHCAVVAAAFLFLALSSQRAVAELLPVVFPLLVPFFPRSDPGKVLKTLALLGLLVLFYLTTSLHQYSSLNRLYPHYPVHLTEHLAEREGQVFNSYEFGCYLDFAQVPPFIHGMTALYKPQLITEFQSALNASPLGLSVLDKYEVRHALLHFPTEIDATELLVEHMWRSPDWKLEAWDDSGLLFTRGRSSEGLTAVRPWAESRWDEPEKARVELEKLLAEHPSARAHIILSELASLREDWEESARQAQLALEILPSTYQGWQALSVASAKLGETQTMMEASAQAVRWGPDRPRAHFNRALALIRTSGDFTGPKAWWLKRRVRYHLKKTLELDPEFAPARQMLDQL